jgi:hypothetical protein
VKPGPSTLMASAQPLHSHDLDADTMTDQSADETREQPAETHAEPAPNSAGPAQAHAEAAQPAPPARRTVTWSVRTVVAASVAAVLLSAGAGAALATWAHDDGSHSGGPDGMPGGFSHQHGQPQWQQPGPMQPPGMPPRDRDDPGQPDAQGD